MYTHGVLARNGQVGWEDSDVPCHRSQFDVTSGAVLRGPAQQPVRSRLVQVDGEDLLVES